MTWHICHWLREQLVAAFPAEIATTMVTVTVILSAGQHSAFSLSLGASSGKTQRVAPPVHNYGYCHRNFVTVIWGLFVCETIPKYRMRATGLVRESRVERASNGECGLNGECGRCYVSKVSRTATESCFNENGFGRNP